MEITLQGKTSIVSDDDKSSVRRAMLTGKTFDACSDRERRIAFEIAREESVRWKKSNDKQRDARETHKTLQSALQDPAKSAKLKELLGL